MLISDEIGYPLRRCETEQLKGRGSHGDQPCYTARPTRRFCRAHGIRRLAVFGSALRGELRPESDVDLLVEFEPDRLPGLLGIARLEQELSPFFDDRRVELRTAEDLSRYFRQDVVEEAEVHYEEG